MVDERKAGLELAIQRELSCRKKVPNPKNEVVKTPSRSPSFTDWTLDHNTSSPEVQSSIELPRLTYPSPRLQNPIEQSLIKIEPCSDEISNPINLTSAHKDWIGTSSKPFDKKQTHSSSELPPNLVYSRKIPAERTQPPNLDLIPKTNTMTHQRPKYFPRPNIPTKTRSSLKRKATIDVQELLKPQPSSRNNNIKTMIKYTENINLFCELCQVSCSSGKAMQDHLKGRPHKAKLVYMQLMKKSNCTVKQPRCNTCQIFCSDRDAMEMHLKGQKHKAKLHELEESRRNGTGGIVVKKKPVFCELCHVSCMNEDLFKMHLKGRQHVTRLEMKRRRMI